MNPISIIAGATAGAIRNVWGWVSARDAAKDRGEKTPRFKLSLLITGVATGAAIGLVNPEPISTALIALGLVEFVGKVAAMTPVVKRIWPRT